MKPAERLPYGSLVVYYGLQVDLQNARLCVVIGTFRYKRDGTGLEDCFGVRPENLEDNTSYSGYLLMPSSGVPGCIHSFWFDVTTGYLKAV